MQLLDGLVDPRDVAEGDLGRVSGEPLGAGLAERHHFGAAALDLVHEEDPEAEEEDERDDVRQQAEQRARLFGFDVVGNTGRFQLREQFGRGLFDVARFPRFAVLQLDFEDPALVLELDVLDFALGDFLRYQGLVAVTDFVGGAGVEEFRGQEGQHDHDQDRKRGTLEETTHGSFHGPGERFSSARLARSAYHQIGRRPEPFRPVEPQRKAGCDGARRGPGRSRSRSGRGSRSPHSASADRPCGARAW